MTGRVRSTRLIEPFSTHPRMPCLKERKTDSRTYAALPIAVAINGRNPLLSAESVSPFEEILLE